MAEKEYIERSALIAAYDRAHKGPPGGARKLMEDAPAADVVEVKHGKWKLHKDGSGTCDQCCFTTRNAWDYDGWQNYCGHCGARMESINTKT